MRAAVVGGGLAGLAAALDLVDAGHDVTVYEARPTLGGAVQTLPARAGDPEPPPDNGQHIALGCFTEYLAFLDRIGEGGSYARRPLELRVVASDGHVSTITPTLRALLAYDHLPLAERLRLLWVLRRIPRHIPHPEFDAETFGSYLRRLGATQLQIDRFWEVFIRPALNLRTDEVAAAPAVFTVMRALLGRREDSDLILPSRPLGAMHGEAARRALEVSGATVRTNARIESLTDLDADGIVLAVPAPEAAQLLDEPPPPLEDSPIVSIHLLIDRPLLRFPFAALLGSDAHWVFDRGALTGVQPNGGQYLTVVSSAVPELMELRGRELVERIAEQVTSRLGRAELLWSRVSREPRATVALRPNAAAARATAVMERRDVVLAGAWTDTGWPVTMEGAVRSGRMAARALSNATTMVAA
jgi:squalene-associated FAD-dependent desaturase